MWALTIFQLHDVICKPKLCSFYQACFNDGRWWNAIYMLKGMLMRLTNTLNWESVWIWKLRLPNEGVGMNMRYMVIQWGFQYENEVYGYPIKVLVWVMIIPKRQSVCVMDYSVTNFSIWVWLPWNEVSVGVTIAWWY